jgi:hypothetical protein
MCNNQQSQIKLQDSWLYLPPSVELSGYKLMYLEVPDLRSSILLLRTELLE